MAAARPAAVAMSASAMPGATTPIDVEPLAPIPWKAPITPQTVPKSPMNGVVLPVVARKVKARSRRATSSAATRARVL